MPALSAPAQHACVGPNAILQLAHALDSRGGPTLTAAVFAHAGLTARLATPPTRMVPETEVARLNAAVATLLPDTAAADTLAAAGRHTGAYLLANRIPAPARLLLQQLPALLAAPLLLAAIRRHAWTFAGSGTVTVGCWPRPWIEIAPNTLAQRGCPWHRAVFGELFRALVHHDCEVAHPYCAARGDARCRFEIVRPPTRGRCLSNR
ncbi:MAG: bacteriochlorophyll 4-vinyl reductase [Gammaproteobacteria bacterium]